MSIQIDDAEAFHNYRMFYSSFLLLRFFSRNSHKSVHVCFYGFVSDKMGKKHHTGGAARILALLVVVSEILFPLIFRIQQLQVPAAAGKKLK